MPPLASGIPADWREALAAAIEDPSFEHLEAFLRDERARTDTEIYPPESQVFDALRLTPLASVRAVILGQDPYYTKGLAMGLAFSIPEGCRQPRSLQNILKARTADLGLPSPASGSLECWAVNGVLLLNTALTVRHREANSHRREWEQFTNAMIRVTSAQDRPIPFLLWGRRAREKCVLISDRQRCVESAHPAARATGIEPRFVDSRPFVRAEDWLCAQGESPIGWALPGDR